MTPRRLALLALAALFATGGAFWLSSQRHLERAVRDGDALLPGLRGALNDIVEIRIGRGDGARVTLQRDDTGWTVLERHFPADLGKVRKLLLDLSALEIVEEKTHDPARYPTLGVEDTEGPTSTGTRIDLKRRSGAIQGLIVGKASGARESFVRVAGAKASFLARPQVLAETNPARWLDATLLDLDPKRVREVTIFAPGKPARRLEGTDLQPALAGALQSLDLEDVRVVALQTTGRKASVPAAPHARFVTWGGLVIEAEGREDGNRRWLAFAVKTDPAEFRKRPDAAGPIAAAANPATTAPTAASTAAAPGAGAGAGADAKADAARLASRVEGREFEIPTYRYNTLFESSAPVATPAPARAPSPGP